MRRKYTTVHGEVVSYEVGDCGDPMCRGTCTLNVRTVQPAADFEANSTVDDRERRKKLKCSLCPPNRKENAKRKPKHGVKKPRK